MAAPPSAPALGGLPEVGGGLSGLGQQLADAFGSILGSADDASEGPADIDEPGKDADDIDDTLDDDPEEDDEPVEPAAKEPVVEPADTCEPAPPPAPVEPPLPEEPAPTPVQGPPPPEPAPPPTAEPAATPCEIAADELPQVGQ
jgi:hypothetical protein